MTLKSRALNGVVWTGIDKLGSIVLGFVLSVLIARQLEPSDYGLLGMLAFFTGVATIFMDSGFGQALIRKAEPSQDDFNTVFVVNILMGLLAYTILFFAAPLIVDFYLEPRLLDISRVVFLTVIINSFGLIQNTIIQKKIEFYKLTRVNLITLISSGVLGLMAAVMGLGVWALVIQTISAACLRTFLLWLNNDWRPKLKFNYNSFRELFSFGSKMLLSGLIYQLSFNSYQILIGKYYDVKSVGLYTQANKLQQIPASNIDNIVQTVTFPLLSEIQNDDERLRETYKKILKQIAFINFPVMILFSVISEPFIDVFFTNTWIQVAPLLSLLCIAAAFYPVHTLNLNIIKVKGRSDIFLLLEVIKNILLLVILLVTINYNVVVVVIGQVCLSIVALFLHMHFSGKLLKLSIYLQFKEFFLFLLLSCFLGFTALLINLIQLSSFITMSLQIVYFVSSYIGIALLSKNNELNEIISLVKNRIYKHEAQ